MPAILAQSRTRNRLGRVLYSPLVALLYVFSIFHKLCFGWLTKRRAKKEEARLTDDIRTRLAFLFAEGAQIIPSDNVYYPFDYLYVTLAAGALRLRFLWGRGEFMVEAASEFAPQEWHDFMQLLEGIGLWNKPDPSYASYLSYRSLEGFADILRPRLRSLQEALSKDHFETTLKNAARVHQEDAERWMASIFPPKAT